jgi:putative ABC transport system ATP-binding protein
LAERVIELDGAGLSLTSRAGSVEILKSLDLSISAGETVAVVGPSGSGKTSLLMLVGGLEQPTTGRVRVAGHEFGKLDEDSLARVRSEAIGIVFQSFHLVPTMTALENVALPLEFRGRPDARSKAVEALTEVGLVFRLARRHGTTLLLVTHDEALARRCNRLIRVADGRIVADEANAEGEVMPAGAAEARPAGARA